MRSPILVWCLLTTLATPLAAHAAPATTAAPADSATATVRAGNERFQKLLAEKAPASRLTAEFRELFDIGDLARRALVDHWAEMAPADRDKIVDLLRQLVERSYLKSLRSRLKYQVSYSGEQPHGNDVLVQTVITSKRKGRPVTIHVDYILTRSGNRWRVIDVITDDVSMLDNYRSQFNRIIAKEGVKGLRARMERKLAEDEGAGEAEDTR